MCAAAALAICVCWLGTGHAQTWRAPDAEPATRVFMRDRLVLDAYDYRRIDGRVFRRRSAQQQLDLYVLGDRVRSQFSGSFAFDEGLPSEPGRAVVAERQLEPELHSAWVRWDVAPALYVTVGRHDLTSGIGFARIDGASAKLEVERWSLRVASGLRPDDGIVRIDGAAYAPDSEPEARKDFGDHTLLTEAEVALDDATGGLSFGVRHQTALDGEFHDGFSVALAGRAGRADAMNLTGRLRVHPDTGTVERADAVGVLPVGDAWRLTASFRHATPRFPVDSLFSVFPISTYGETSLSARFAPHTTSLSVQAYHRTTRAIGTTGETDHNVGGRIDVRTQDRTRHLHGDLGIGAGGGDAGDVLRLSAGVRYVPDRGPQWQLSQVVGTQKRRSDRQGASSAQADTSWFDRRTGVFTSAAMRANAGAWAQLTVDMTFGWDTRNRGSLRTMALADIALPGRR